MKKILFLCLFFLHLNFIFGTQYYVDTNHPLANDSNTGTEDLPFKNIQASVSGLVPGDTVYVKEGIYNLSTPSGQSNFPVVVYMYRSGNQTHPITFKAYPGHSPIIDGLGEAKGFYIPGNKNNIIIDGFEMRNLSWAGVLSTYSSENISVINNYIHHINNQPGQDTNVAGIKFMGTSYAYAYNNTIHDVAFDGNLYNQNTAGVHTYGWSNAIIENNTFYNSYSGVYQKRAVTNVKSSIIRNNYISNTETAIKFTGTNSNSANHVDSEIYNNVIDNSTYGILIKVFSELQSYNSSIHNNLIKNTNYGLFIVGMKDVKIYNNIFIDNINYILQTKPSNQDSEISYMDYNLYFNTSEKYGLNLWTNSFLYDTFSDWQDSCIIECPVTLNVPSEGPDQNSLFVDPRLDSNLIPLENSPLCGSGVNGSDIGPFLCEFEPAPIVEGICEAQDDKTCYYVDPIIGDDDSGDGSFANPYKSLKNLMYYYSSNSRPSTWQRVNPGDYIYLMGGIYNQTWSINDPLKPEDEFIFIARGWYGDEDNYYNLKAYPGEKPIFSPTNQRIALKIYQSSYWNIEGIEITNNSYQLGVSISSVDNVYLSNLSVHNIDGVDNNNNAGINIKSSTNVELSNSVLYDNYDRVGADTGGVTSENSMNLVIFKSDNISIFNNSFYQTKEITEANTGGCLKVKHANQRNGFTKIFGNTFENCKFMAIGIGSNNTHIYDNLVINSSSAIYMKDHGGDTYQQNILIEKNTFYNSPFIFVPVERWNGPPKNITVRNNILYDTQTYSLYKNIFTIGTYSTNELMNTTLPELSIDNNCYYNPIETPQFCYFCDNGDSNRDGGGSFIFSQWQGVEFDINSFNINPDFDSNYMPREDLCSNKGYNSIQELTSPQNLTYMGQTTTTISLSWTASLGDNLVGYRIFRNNSEVGDTINTNFTDVSLSSSSNYNYYIQAYDSLDTVINSQSIIVSTIEDTQQPSPPSSGGSSGGGGGGGGSPPNRGDSSFSPESTIEEQNTTNQNLTVNTENSNSNFDSENACTPSFDYTQWSICENSEQTRIKTDLNNCFSEEIEQRKCLLNGTFQDTITLNSIEIEIERFDEKKYFSRFKSDTQFIKDKLDLGNIFTIYNEENNLEYLGRQIDSEDGDYFYSLEPIDENVLNSGILEENELREVSLLDKIYLFLDDKISSSITAQVLQITLIFGFLMLIFVIHFYIKKHQKKQTHNHLSSGSKQRENINSVPEAEKYRNYINQIEIYRKHHPELSDQETRSNLEKLGWSKKILDYVYG